MAFNQTEKPDHSISDSDAAWVAKCVVEMAHKDKWLKRQLRLLAGEMMLTGAVKTLDAAYEQAAAALGATLDKVDPEAWVGHIERDAR